MISLLRQREQAAVGVLYDRYSGAIYRMIYRVVHSDEIAEDVLQETFTKIWTEFSSYDTSKGKLFTWMARIGRNLALDKIKSKDHRNALKNQEIDSVVPLIDSELNSVYNADRIGLAEIVRSLKPEQEELVELIYFQGYTQVEASDQLGIPLGTVKTRLRAAMNIIRKIFE
ncbi:MAG: sigma-70 family RNA polymerase sigma factor [Candidatus Kapaibacterium sp.]